MLNTLEQIINLIKDGQDIDAKRLDRIIRDRNRQTHDSNRTVAKKRLMSRYLRERADKSEAWLSWNIDEDTHRKIVSTLRAKPRRTASGVATVTVLTKPWPCANDCIYCPNDIRMPKSYLSDEPACQRAERNFFDPYLQVISRLAVLEDMGHVIDKVELIVLGGTWSDYPQDYRLWFTKEMFRAANEFSNRSSDEESEISRIRKSYERSGFKSDAISLEEEAHTLQQDVDLGRISYNEALLDMASKSDRSTLDLLRGVNHDETELAQQLEAQHRINETCENRIVGLVFETRPDAIDEDELIFLRKLGATKVQMGIQSLDDRILEKNTRRSNVDSIERSMKMLRLYGFKTHIHLMVNLLGATPESDIEQFEKLVGDERFKPDEIKLYPCALVESAALTDLHGCGAWRPYTQEELLHILVKDVQATPPFTRISRMIRDISAKDILVGNKMTNLRQMVEAEVCKAEAPINEMRMREISTDDIAFDDLSMQVVSYECSGTSEKFIQWVMPTGRLAAFLRLSLPNRDDIEGLEHRDALIDGSIPAMIREVHVYGKVAKLHEANEGSQHVGLGASMIEEACRIAKDDGYTKMNVISSIGTRQYYRALGFKGRGLYQTRDL